MDWWSGPLASTELSPSPIRKIHKHEVMSKVLYPFPPLAEIVTIVVKNLPCPNVRLDDRRSLLLQTTTPGDDWTSGVASCGEQVDGVQLFSGLVHLELDGLRFVWIDLGIWVD